MARQTTTRGVLWEVIAPALRWPMRSPLRFGGVVVAVIVVIWLIAHLNNGPAPADEHGRTASSGSSATASASAAPSASTAPVPNPADAAVSFVTAWAKPGLAQAQWLAGVNAAHPDESLAQALASTDPKTVPATKVLGLPRVLSQSGTEARVEVSTDGPKVVVVLSLADNVWSITNILPGG